MNPRTRQRARELVRLLAPNDYSRLLETRIHESGFGYDPYGLERESAMLAFLFFKMMYTKWFRVESSGLENVPLAGPVLLTPNHSGVFPIDGAMLAVDLCTKLKTPRVMRAVVDHFACCLPFINVFFARCGQVIGARGNVRGLLEQGEMVTLFPEGHKGTGKPYRERYKLRPFNVGFMELSLIHKAPIVPTAVIGAEEQYPFMFNVKPLAKAFKLPYFPATPLLMMLGPMALLPLPTRYFIRYGEPLHFYRDYPAEAVRDVEAVQRLVGRVRSRVQEMIDQGLKERKCVFGFSSPPLKKPFSLMHAAIGSRKKRPRQGRRRHEPDEQVNGEPAPSGSCAQFQIGHEANWPVPKPIELTWKPVAQRPESGIRLGGDRTRSDREHLRWRVTQVIGARAGSARSERENPPAL